MLIKKAENPPRIWAPPHIRGQFVCPPSNKCILRSQGICIDLRYDGFDPERRKSADRQKNFIPAYNQYIVKRMRPFLINILIIYIKEVRKCELVTYYTRWGNIHLLLLVPVVKRQWTISVTYIFLELITILYLASMVVQKFSLVLSYIARSSGQKRQFTDPGKYISHTLGNEE